MRNVDGQQEKLKVLFIDSDYKNIKQCFSTGIGESYQLYHNTCYDEFQKNRSFLPDVMIVNVDPDADGTKERLSFLCNQALQVPVILLVSSRCIVGNELLQLCGAVDFIRNDVASLKYLSALIYGVHNRHIEKNNVSFSINYVGQEA